jgi:hypothetical protein
MGLDVHEEPVPTQVLNERQDDNELRMVECHGIEHLVVRTIYWHRGANKHDASASKAHPKYVEI